MNVSALQLKSTGEHTCGKLSLLLVTTVENPAHHRKLGASQWEGVRKDLQDSGLS